MDLTSAKTKTPKGPQTATKAKPSATQFSLTHREANNGSDQPRLSRKASNPKFKHRREPKGEDPIGDSLNERI